MASPIPAPPPGFKIVQGGAPPPPPPEEAAPEKNYRQSDAGEVVRGAVENLGPSAVKMGTDIATAAAHPVDTVEALTNLGSGAINLIPGVDSVMKFGQDAGLLHKPDEAELAKVEKQKEMARSVGQMYADKYGSMEGFKQAVATDPMSVLADLSTVFTGGGAALSKAGSLTKAAQVTNAAGKPTMLARAGRAASKVGEVTNPLYVPGKVVGNTVGRLAKNYAGVASGAGKKDVSEAFQAGKEGGKRLEKFTKVMRGAEDQDVMAKDAMRALQNMRDKRSAQYVRQMQTTKAWKQPVDVTPIGQAFKTIEDGLTQNGASNASAAELSMMRRIEKALAEHVNSSPQWDTPWALDALKKKISKLAEWENRHDVVSGIPAKISEAIGDTIKNSGVPGYAEAMADYGAASDTIGQLQKALSLTDKAARETTIRKLLSTSRNNVSTNFGKREQMVKTLEAEGAPHLSSQVAGHSLNSWEPRGLARYFSPGAAAGVPTLLAGAGAIEPVTAVALGVGHMAASSPRTVGEIGKAAGQAARVAPPALLAANAVADATQTGAEGQQPPPTPQQASAVPQPQAPGITREQALADAQKALDAGADPIKVKERLGEILKTLRTQ